MSDGNLELDIDELEEKVSAMTGELEEIGASLERIRAGLEWRDEQLLATVNVVGRALHRHLGAGQDPELDHLFADAEPE